MPKLIICAVRDRGVDAFGQPIFVRHVNEATRSFRDEINRDGSTFFNHPDDYDLYTIGTFDDSTGEIEFTGAHMLVVGKSLVNDTKDN